ncbi:hypothetical protein C8R43DRAFT_1140164 [Mycena crocata]|nr:hypothetical protein C8R43DRAFT_1140164 [Mycena crocata]
MFNESTVSLEQSTSQSRKYYTLDSILFPMHNHNSSAILLAAILNGIGVHPNSCGPQNRTDCVPASASLAHLLGVAGIPLVRTPWGSIARPVMFLSDRLDLIFTLRIDLDSGVVAYSFASRSSSASSAVSSSESRISLSASVPRSSSASRSSSVPSSSASASRSASSSACVSSSSSHASSSVFSARSGSAYHLVCILLSSASPASRSSASSVSLLHSSSAFRVSSSSSRASSSASASASHASSLGVSFTHQQLESLQSASASRPSSSASRSASLSTHPSSARSSSASISRVSSSASSASVSRPSSSVRSSSSAHPKSSSARVSSSASCASNAVSSSAAHSSSASRSASSSVARSSSSQLPGECQDPSYTASRTVVPLSPPNTPPYTRPTPRRIHKPPHKITTSSLSLALASSPPSRHRDRRPDRVGDTRPFLIVVAPPPLLFFACPSCHCRPRRATSPSAFSVQTVFRLPLDRHSQLPPSRAYAFARHKSSAIPTHPSASSRQPTFSAANLANPTEHTPDIALRATSACPRSLSDPATPPSRFPLHLAANPQSINLAATRCVPRGAHSSNLASATGNSVRCSASPFAFIACDCSTSRDPAYPATRLSLYLPRANKPSPWRIPPRTRPNAPTAAQFGDPVKLGVIDRAPLELVFVGSSHQPAFVSSLSIEANHLGPWWAEVHVFLGFVLFF